MVRFNKKETKLILTILIKKMKIGSKVKNFSAEMTGNKKFSLKEFTGKNIVLYFYPRDNTPGCTSESIDFRDNF